MLECIECGRKLGEDGVVPHVIASVAVPEVLLFALCEECGHEVLKERLGWTEEEMLQVEAAAEGPVHFHFLGEDVPGCRAALEWFAKRMKEFAGGTGKLDYD